jgi:hypothetical protein
MRFVLIFLAAVSFLSAISVTRPQAPPAVPRIVSLCDILKDPKAYDGQNVQFRGQVVSEFEDFSVYDPSCVAPYGSGVWLMFGGYVNCPTPSTVNDVGRVPGTDVKFRGKNYALIKNDEFQTFHRFVTTRRSRQSVYQVTATLEGTFFAGRTEKDKKGRAQLPGYGHMGCCRLFIIHEISRVNAEKNPTA